MNVKWENSEKGAVLVVALIMLAMVTFLVVAFVGFARFERASVTASLKRTEASFISGSSQSISLISEISSISGDINATPILKVSQRSGTNEFVPVYIDTTGNGEQNSNSTYLNLNSEINNPALPGDPYLQLSNPATLTVGDPEWIGLLENPDQPHSAENRFIARTAYMTVPVSEILNVRYNHRIYTESIVNPRGQGESPRSIWLGAPMVHMGFDIQTEAKI